MSADGDGGRGPGDMTDETCVRCSEPLGVLPKVRRKDGRAICLDCLTERERQAVERQAKQQAKQPAGRPPAEAKPEPTGAAGAAAGAMGAAAAGRTARPSGTSNPASADPAGDSGAFGLEPESSRPATAAPTAVRMDPQTPAIESEALRRARAARKATVGSTAGPPRPCHGCGYDLRGVKSGVCPECGERAKLAKTSRYADIEADVTRAAWMQPIIAAAVGLALVVGVSLFRDGVPAVIGNVISLGILFVIAFVTYFVLGAIWFGLDSTLGLLIVQVFGAFALAFGCFVLVSPLPLGIPMLVTLMIYGITLGEITDFERSEGFITSAITILTCGVGLIAIVAALT